MKKLIKKLKGNARSVNSL